MTRRISASVWLLSSREQVWIPREWSVVDSFPELGPVPEIVILASPQVTPDEKRKIEKCQEEGALLMILAETEHAPEGLRADLTCPPSTPPEDLTRRCMALLRLHLQEKTAIRTVSIEERFRNQAPPHLLEEIATYFRERFQEILEISRERERRMEEAFEREKNLREQLNREHQLAQEAQKRAEEADRAKSEFLANMSHDLRTPLHSILGICEALGEYLYGPLESRQLEMLKTIEKSGGHLLELINDILDLSKISAGQLELHYEEVDLEPFCLELVRMIRPQATEQGQSIHFANDGKMNSIHVDQRRLRQIIINLLGNAVKFTPRDGQIGILINSLLEKDEVSLTVWDTGIGISPEDRKKLFEPFVQLERGLKRSQQGTGLGLSLVSRLVELHEGRIQLESEVGKGSRFTIFLPRESRTSPRERTSFRNETTPRIRKEDSPSSEFLVLIVDDTPTNIGHVQDYLEMKGIRVMTASTGKEALAKVEEQMPDLVLMDIQLPDIDGFEVIRRLRKKEATRSLHIIAATAMSMQGDEERCREAGADGYLSKPFRLSGLYELIRSLSAPQTKK